MFLSSRYLALGFLTNCKNIWENNEVCSSEIENEDLSLAPGVGMEKIILQLGGYWVHLASVNTYWFKGFAEVGQMLTVFS